MECKKCNKSIFAVVRKNDVVEYRIIDTNDRNGIGIQGWKGNWRTEEKKVMKILGIRCQNCDEWLVKSGDMPIDIDGDRRIESIDGNKGVKIISTGLEKFM